MHLEELGWNAELAAAFQRIAQGTWQPARVVAEHRSRYELLGATGALEAELSGRLRHEGTTHPAVGDWVAVRASPGSLGLVEALLPRRRCLARKAAGATSAEQVLAANVDAAWLVTSLDQDLNPRRLERYLTVAWESGAVPRIVLTKADACPARDEPLAQIASVAAGVAVHVVSAVADEGIAALESTLAPGRTVALLGSSGVGKSTLVNRLLGEHRQRVHAIASDGRGRHTTTERRLFLLPGRGLLVDTPGMRELGVSLGANGLDASFADVADLALACRFRDCGHDHEPACAVREAVERGELEPGRLASFRKLRREVAFQERKQNARARAEHGRSLRPLMKAQRRVDDE